MTQAQVQTQTINKRLIGPVPVKLYLAASFRDRTKEGARLRRLQWDQPYSDRDLMAPTIKMAPMLRSGDVAVLEIWEEKREWWSEERKIRAPPHAAMRIVIKLYKPVRPTKPRYIFVVAEYSTRSTKMGGRSSAWLLNSSAVWSYTASNISSSGRHGKKLFMVLSKEPVRIHVEHVSNRGNRREWIEVFDFDTARTVDVYETVEKLGSWGYGAVLRIRDNLHGGEFIAVRLDYHEAYKSAAKTTHTWEPKDAMELLYDTSASSKTHWSELYRVVKPVVIETTRITGSGKSEWRWRITVDPTRNSVAVEELG